MSDKKMVVGCDHGGVELKRELVDVLTERGWTVEDVGCHTGDSVDYPDYAATVARRVAAGEARLGLLICGTGIGMSMAANRVPGVRAALCGDAFSAEMTRRHNDANVLCLGARVVGPGLAATILAAFLDAPFDGDRHRRRIDKIHALELTGKTEDEA